MKNSTTSLRHSVSRYCAAIGQDPLLVQGAGGNVSWKDENTLWIKASGAWLADALDQNIFLPVDLSHLRQAIDNKNFSTFPQLRKKSALKPSIETLLHALMPHQVVMHLHAIEVLACLVRNDCEEIIRSSLGDSVAWVIVDYHKPGASLAAAVSAALKAQPAIEVVFLKNHGVVIGGEDVSLIQGTLNKLISALSVLPMEPCESLSSELALEFGLITGYLPLDDLDVHQLALNAVLFNRLKRDWALYPDHVVFLGREPYTYDTWMAFEGDFLGNENTPEFLFIAGQGVFVKPDFNKAKRAQLRCYYDVLTRLKSEDIPKSLTKEQVAELLDWDAEHYRISMAK